ncbi:nuclear envelope integral membrane protein [Culicoides brevitarsis]|uniref:nuclear envelope integral membrane protein n=1 Tax=Culicoides brevitarsis TaxID=469753 RepID=UPI00307C9F36
MTLKHKNLVIRTGIVFIITLFISGSSQGSPNVFYLEPGSVAEYNPIQHRTLGFRDKQLQIYCYKGKPKYLINVFNTITLRLDIDSEEFTQYEGSDPDVVNAAFEDHRSIFSFNFMTSKKRLVHLDPFNQSCIGIDADAKFKVHMQLIRVDFWRVLLLCAGLFVFFSAPSLSENPLFYYLSGVLVGISASFLIVVWLVSKLIPRKPMMYGALIGGWGLSFYFGQMVYENIRVILVTHQMYVFWYVFVSGIISFVVCYRMGPPKNERSKNLIKWGLQTAAMLLIFYSSHFQEATVGINILIALIYHFPVQYINKTKTYWKRRFPPKRRFLTEEEYLEQGARETAKALAELREFCSSPEAKPWKTMLKLRDPARFASFIEGDSHLDDTEILDYETTQATFTDNESGDENLSEDESDEKMSRDSEAEISEDEQDAVGRRNTRPVGWAYDRFSRTNGYSPIVNGRHSNGRSSSTPLRNHSTPTQRRSASRQSASRTETTRRR